LKSETKRLRPLVSHWELNTDIPRLGQYGTTHASPRARNGYAGRVWWCDVPHVVKELDRDPSLYLCEFSANVQLSSEPKYSKKALVAYLRTMATRSRPIPIARDTPNTSAAQNTCS